MTKVLIAVDDTEASLAAARAAHRLFGDDAEYLVVNVAGSGIDSAVAWGYAYPISMPMLDVPAMPLDGRQIAQVQAEQTASAEHTAAEVAAKAHLEGAETVGETGDVATAVVSAARDHGVDVIVVGSHERSWFSRLFTGSVATTLVKESEIPVLVIR